MWWFWPEFNELVSSWCEWHLASVVAIRWENSKPCSLLVPLGVTTLMAGDSSRSGEGIELRLVVDDFNGPLVRLPMEKRFLTLSGLNRFCLSGSSPPLYRNLSANPMLKVCRNRTATPSGGAAGFGSWCCCCSCGKFMIASLAAKKPETASEMISTTAISTTQHTQIKRRRRNHHYNYVVELTEWEQDYKKQKQKTDVDTGKLLEERNKIAEATKERTKRV